MSSFANRIKKNFDHLCKWAVREKTNAFRIYDRDMPEFPFSVDYYAGSFVVCQFQRKANPSLFSLEDDEIREAKELKIVLEGIIQVFEVAPEEIHVKKRFRRASLEQYQKLDARNVTKVVLEHDLKFLVNLSDYLDTGLFLDHRSTRALVRKRAAGKRVLNLFAYTGSLGVHAAAGGASFVKTVDLSNTYLEWARENFALNDFVGEQYAFERDDIFKFLPKESQSKARYDFILCDPPSFSNSKKMENHFDVQEHHVTLLTQCLNILVPGGTLLFSNNLRNFKLDKEAFPACKIENITEKTLSPDFRNDKIHNAWILQST
jgi:23S rRNA G2069 N7-methylase RlmK/C1962 C5-methylase RlmI